MLFFTTGASRVTDERDKIFALLGILREATRTHKIEEFPLRAD